MSESLNMVTCEICSKSSDASYKCPVCRISYCTVQCFKVHKESHCEQPHNSGTQNNTESEENKYNYVTDDTLPIHKLKLLENNEELHKILSNKHVRDILTGIDNCKKPNEMVEQAMKEPIFVEFVDACLKVVGENKEEFI